MPHSAYIGIASLAVVLLVHAVVVAFLLGRLFQRVSTLERDGGVMGTVRTDMATMAADVRHLSGSVDELKGRLAWLTETPPTMPGRPRRRARQGEV